MQIRSITVSSSRKLPNPNVDYASVSSFASITADVAEEDSLVGCAVQLQAQADGMVEQHLASIGERLRARSRDARAENKTAETAGRLADKYSK